MLYPGSHRRLGTGVRSRLGRTTDDLHDRPSIDLNLEALNPFISGALETLFNNSAADFADGVSSVTYSFTGTSGCIA